MNVEPFEIFSSLQDWINSIMLTETRPEMIETIQAWLEKVQTSYDSIADLDYLNDSLIYSEMFHDEINSYFSDYLPIKIVYNQEKMYALWNQMKEY